MERIPNSFQNRPSSLHYKLIAKNSIEEKILEMQEVKKHLADEILSGEMGGLSALTKDELMALLKI